MDKRFSSLVADPHFILSAVLEPQFQFRWARSADEEQIARTTVTTLSSQVQLPLQKKQEILMTCCPTWEVIKAPVKQPMNLMRILGTVTQLRIITDLLLTNQCWSISASVPVSLHLKHHCIPATSAAMERVFSVAGSAFASFFAVVSPWWSLSPLRHQALHRGTSEQAHRLPGAQLPQPRSSDDKAYTGVPAQLPTQFTSYCAYKAVEH